MNCVLTSRLTLELHPNFWFAGESRPRQRLYSYSYTYTVRKWKKNKKLFTFGSTRSNEVKHMSGAVAHSLLAMSLDPTYIWKRVIDMLHTQNLPHTYP